jgi:hypothetical protein
MNRQTEFDFDDKICPSDLRAHAQVLVEIGLKRSQDVFANTGERLGLWSGTQT